MFSRTFLSVSYRVSATSNISVHKVICHRSLHIACKNMRRDFRIGSKQAHKFRSPVLTSTFIRYINESATKPEDALFSTSLENNNPLRATDSIQADQLISQIPEPPTPLIQEVAEAVGAPTLESLGLGSWYPPGLIQHFLDFLHTTGNLPWWATVMLTTVGVKLLMLPVVIKIQRYSARMNNIQPEMQYIQEQLTEARKMGDHMEVHRLTHELYEFMKQKGLNPIKNAGLPLIQAPVFLSFFWALRGMVQAPVESMKYGGLWWFTDLTVTDPYYILPILTSATMALTLELGTDTVRMQSLGATKYLMRAAPIIMFPFIINFEGAILCYWVSSNLFSLVQVSILRLPKVRAYCNIPEMIIHDPKKLPTSKKKFVQGFKETWSNLRVAREASSRQLYDETIFEKAGRGPVPKTYKFDPTKRHPVTNVILTKKRA